VIVEGRGGDTPVIRIHAGSAAAIQPPWMAGVPQLQEQIAAWPPTVSSAPFDAHPGPPPSPRNQRRSNNEPKMKHAPTSEPEGNLHLKTKPKRILAWLGHSSARQLVSSSAQFVKRRPRLFLIHARSPR
jgi:hypothetical protein